MRHWSAKWAGLRFSTPVVVVYAIASFVGAMIAFSSRDELLGVALVAALIVSGFAVLLLVVLRGFITRDQDVDVVVFFVIALGVGVARGVVMMIVGSQWQLIGQTSAVAQIINSGISAIVWLFLAGLFFASRERYRRLYRSLLVQGATHRQATSLVDADWDRNPAIVDMRARVSPHITEAQLSPTPEALMRTAEAIRIEIEHNLRPLSHRLWFGAFDEYPHARLTALVKDSITAFRMPIRGVVAAWLIGGLIGGPGLFGTTRGLLATVISSAVLTGLLITFTSIARRHPSFGLGVTYLIVAGTIPLVAADAALRSMGLDSDFTLSSELFFLLPLALIALMVGGLAIALAHADRSVVLSVTKRYATPSADAVTRALTASTYLHNTVQSELTGVAMQLTQAAESGDAKRSRAAVRHAQETMNRSLTQGFINQQTDPMKHVDRLVNAWQGICEVDIAVEPDLADNPRVSVAIQVVEELITNAVRHSGATQLTAHLSENSGGISITCRINRQWQSGGIEGLGTTWMAAIAPQGVYATQSESDTVLQLTLT